MQWSSTCSNNNNNNNKQKVEGLKAKGIVSSSRISLQENTKESGKNCDGEPMASKNSRRLKNSKKELKTQKYLKPGALAQLRDARVNTRASCTDIGRKRILVMENDNKGNALENDDLRFSSPHKGSVSNPIDMHKKLQETPKTPKTPRTPTTIGGDVPESVERADSRLESLPLDVLVRILCYLHHDQLRAVFHVSQRVRRAVVIARQWHFNYTTPDRGRQEMLRLITPRPDEHWPFLVGGGANSSVMPRPITPKAPRQGPRPPSRLSLAEMRQITASLFQGPSARLQRRKPRGLPRPVFRSLASHRVLFYEDELCQAVSQNTLR